MRLCTYCREALGPDDGESHDACTAEWRRRAREHACTVCGVAKAMKMYYLCKECAAAGYHPRYEGYHPERA